MRNLGADSPSVGEGGAQVTDLLDTGMWGGCEKGEILEILEEPFATGHDGRRSHG
jgi:hypothetical protein